MYLSFILSKNDMFQCGVDTLVSQVQYLNLSAASMPTVRDFLMSGRASGPQEHTKRHLEISPALITTTDRKFSSTKALASTY